MRKVIRGILLIVGIWLVFGGVGYMELGGSCLIGTAESLMGFGLCYVVSKLEPPCQPRRCHLYSNPQDPCRRV